MELLNQIISKIKIANEKRAKARETKLFYEERKALPWKSRSYAEIPYPDHVRVRGKGYLRIRDVTFNLKNEYPPLPLALIVKEASRYLEDVYIEKFKDEPMQASCKDISGLLGLELNDKDWVDLYVENKREQSKIIAIRLYAGITTQGEIPNFDRLG